MRFALLIALFITVALPFAAYAQQSKTHPRNPKTMDGIVTGIDGNKYWSGFKIESGGKDYIFVAEYNARQGINPTVVGGKCCGIGTRVRVTYIGSIARHLLNVTRIDVLGFVPPDGRVILVPVPTNTNGSPKPMVTPTPKPPPANVSTMTDPKPMADTSARQSGPTPSPQEWQTILKPNQLFTYSLASEQEKIFVLQMKKGDFADIQSLAREGLNRSFEIYDSARKKLLEKSEEGEDSIWFVAQTDGEFMLISKLRTNLSTLNSGGQVPAEKVTIQYNNKFRLPAGTKLKDIRKINGYEIKIMSALGTYDESKSIVLIEKNGQLKRLLKSTGGEPKGFSFPYPDYVTKADSLKEKRIISLVKNTVDKTGDGIPDVMIQYFSGGAHCCFKMDLINLGETVETVDSIEMGNAEWIGIDRNPSGGLRFITIDNAWAYWNISFAGSPLPSVVVEFTNGKLRPNFDAMKKPPPSLASLKAMAQSARLKIKNVRYTGADNCDFDCFDDAFWGEMLDLIYSGNEALAWQYFELIWPPEKQGKALFIRDFKKQLLESQYWKMILEDNGPLATVRQQVKDGRDDEAMATLRGVLASDPMSAESYLLLGKIHLRRGEIDLAISSFKTCLFWDNHFIEAHVSLGKIYVRKNNCLQAKSYAASAIEIDAKNPDAIALQRITERCSKDGGQAILINYRYEADVQAPSNEAKKTGGEERNAAVQADFAAARSLELLDRTLSSPDKKRVVAIYHRISDTPSEYRLDMYSSDGKLLKKLTAGTMAVHFPDTIVWSPDSTTLAFVAIIRAGRDKTGLNPAASAAVKRTDPWTNSTKANRDVPTKQVGAPTSAAPTEILAFRTEQIYLCNADGGALKALTQNEGLLYFYYVWSPNSTMLAALAASPREWKFLDAVPGSNGEHMVQLGRLRIIEKNGRERLLDDNLTSVRPVWSPDSAKVADAFDTEVRVYDANSINPTQAAIPLRKQLLISSQAYDLDQRKPRASNAAALPVQPIGPATGAQEEVLAKLPDLTAAEIMAANSNMEKQPGTLPGGDGYNAWANGGSAPIGATPSGAPPLEVPPPQSVQTGGQVLTIDPNGGSQFMSPDEKLLVSYNPVVAMAWTADDLLYLRTAYIKRMKNKDDSVMSFSRWHRLILTSQADTPAR